MQRKQGLIIIGLVALVAIGAGAYLWSSGNGTSALLATAGGAADVTVKPTDMVHGDANAPVTMVEFASMTCPHCAAFQADVIPQLTTDYIDTGKVKFVFREFPLDGAATLASSTARCMTGDAYFAFIDLLFRNQQEWLMDFDSNNQITKEDIEEGLVRMGRMAGMSREQVLTCANDPANQALVVENWQEGQTKYNVQATPSFLINGKMHRGAPTYDAIKQALDAELAD